MTVGEVKLKLQNLYLLPADDQLLYFSGVLLNNAHLLSSYGIGHNSNLEVVMKDHVSQDTWDQVSRGANEAEEALRTEIRRMHSEIIRSHEQGRIQDGHRSSLPVESPVFSPCNSILLHDHTHTNFKLSLLQRQLQLLNSPPKSITIKLITPMVRPVLVKMIANGAQQK